MRNIKTLLSLDRSRWKTDLYGVEIEVEGVRLPTPEHLSEDVWRVERDGSLKAREAWEYVTPGPLSLKGVADSLKVLQDTYDKLNSKIDESIRAGVHVHMNVQDWNIKQVMTFATCYYLLEYPLLKWCGPAREGNLFTHRTGDAEYVLFRVLKSLNTRNLKYLKDDIIRYASLNFCSLFKYGSLEFRGMRGTGKLDDIMLWVTIIDDLREASETFSDPVDVISSMSGDGELEFLRRCLPNTYHLFEKTDDIEKNIRESARRVQMIAFGVDWTEIGKRNANIFDIEQGGF